MQVGAVLVLGGCIGHDVSHPSGRKYFSEVMPSFFGAPAAVLDLLGEPILYRIIESLQKCGVGPIFLIADDVFANHAVVKDISRWRVHVRNAPREELRKATQEALTTCRESGARTAIVMQASAYVELDVAEMLAFHAASGQAVTSAQDTSGPLDIMMVGSQSTGQIRLPNLRTPQSTPFEYTHRQYANRLSTPLDLRRLAQDALLQRCAIRPNGNEVRPGVWIAPSARLHPRARVVNPSYVGAHTRLRSGVVITRGTSIEHHCEVDRGSVVENASILPHTYVGSSLDIAHSLVNRNAMVDVRQAIEVEISDRSLIGSTSPLPKSVSKPKPSPARPLQVMGHVPRRTLSDVYSAFFPETQFLSPGSVRFSYGASEAEPELGELPRAGDSRTA